MGKPNTVLQQQSTPILSSKPWKITLPHDLPLHLIPAYNFINAELALHPCMTPPVDHVWLDYIWKLYARNSVGLDERKKSLRTIMQGLKWRFDVQQRIILVWWQLVKEGLVKRESMEMPIDICCAHDRSDELKCTLLRFEYLDWLKGYGGSWGSWDDGGLRGQFEEPVAWLAVMILRSDARRKSVADVVRWIEEKGVFGVLGEEKVEERGVSPEPEYGWIDEDGIGFNDDEELDDTKEEEEEVEQVGNLTDLLVREKGHEPDHRIGMIVPHGQDMRDWAERTLERLRAVKDAYDMVIEGGCEIDPGLIELVEDFAGHSRQCSER